MEEISPLSNFEQLANCPACNFRYQPGNSIILGEDENRTVLHLSCKNCETAVLVFVSAGQVGIVSLGMLTDLDAEEAKRVFMKEAISADQVIQMHETLKNFKGGVSELM
jgi:hypothetical protein